MKESDFQKDLLDFLHKSPTPFHATNSLANRLRKSGFIELHELDKWDINPGRYFVTRNQSSLIAFQLATRSIGKTGIRMVGAHTDSPTLKLKPLPEVHNKGLFQLGVEVLCNLAHFLLDVDLDLQAVLIILPRTVVAVRAALLAVDNAPFQHFL